MSIKYSHPEFDTNFYFSYDKTKKFKDLILAEQNGNYLLNIRKKYSNNEYFGTTFTAVLNNELVNNFKCKDRGWTEELVDNKEEFIKTILRKGHFAGSTSFTDEAKNFTYIKKENNLGTITDRDFDIHFVYLNGKYYSTTFTLKNPHAVWRGLYGARKEDLKRKEKDFGQAVLETSTPSDEDLQEFYRRAQISFSNVYTEVNTEYSHIKVFQDDS